MEEIDLKKLFDYFKEKFGLLLIMIISACLVGCIYGLFIQKPMYKSDTKVILSGNETSSNQITQSDIALYKNLVDTYAEIVKSRRVLEQVISELNLDMTYESLYNKVSVTAVNNTEIIKITVSDDDAVNARNIANKTADVFTKEIVKLYKLNNVNILDEATIADSPYNINVFKQVTIYFMIGFILGVGLIFILFYFDRTIKSIEQVEQKIKLPILGGVQLYSNGGKK